MEVIYTDGSCIGNPGPAGWAWWNETTHVIANDHMGEATNNRAELMAVIKAMRAHRGRAIDIHTDSKYVSDAINKGWLKNWKAKGWKTSANKPVKNQDLWEQFDELFNDNVKLTWIKGHSGNAGNDLVDKIAYVSANAKSK